MDHLAEIREKFKAKGITDESFIERYFDRHGEEITREIEHAAGESPKFFEDALQGVIDGAKDRYYWSTLESKIPEQKTGEIILKRRYKRKKKSETVGAWERQESFARHLTALMSPRGSALVGTQLLDPQEAESFLDSPIASAYPPGFITHYGLDAILNAGFVEESEDRRGPYKVGQIEGDFGVRYFKLRPLGWIARDPVVRNPVYPGDSFRGLDFSLVRPATRIDFVVHPEDSNKRIVARENSVLAQLDKATSRYHRYPISPEKALWCILTGEFIPEPPIRIRWEREHTPGWYRRAKIIMEVEGWMSAEEVADHYRHAQKEVLGKTPQSLALKSWTLLEFVNENKDLTWSELFDKWNKEHPVWHFKQVGHLHQLHKNASKKLVNGN